MGRTGYILARRSGRGELRTMRVLTALGLILGVVNALTACIAIVVIVRIAQARAGIPRVRAGDSLPPAPGLLSIVIPAHNEARVIEGSVRGPRAQADRRLYREAVQALLRAQSGLTIMAGGAEGLELDQAGAPASIISTPG